MHPGALAAGTLPQYNTVQAQNICHTIGPSDLLQPSPVPLFKTCPVFLIYLPECPNLSSARSCVSFFVQFKSNLLVTVAAFTTTTGLNVLRGNCFVTCFHATRQATVQILHILQLCSICHNRPSHSNCVTLCHIHVHCTPSSNPKRSFNQTV